MPDHAFLVRICDSSLFQIAHCGERLVHLRPHRIEKIVRKFHPADVDRKSEISVAQKVLLESLPERRRSHKSVMSDRWRVTSIYRSGRTAMLFTCHMSPVTCHSLSAACSAFARWSRA